MGFLARNKCAVGVVSVVAIAVVVGIVLAVTLTQSSSKSDDKNDNQNEKTFTIDYEADTFMMDGKPFRYVAGSFHYFRALPQTWREKFKTMRAAGLNAVDLYIQWSLHNPKDGVYNWNGIANIEQVVQIASEEDLYVILRPGPYICAEIDNGGLPFWLAHKYPGIQLRTHDSDYEKEVTKWYSMLMPQFEKHWYGNGGKIIMVQVENEYGAFKACDKQHKEFLRDETFKYTKNNTILFTTDRPIDDELTCGSIEGVFATTDFGLANRTDVEFNFGKLREVQPHGPLVNTEFYTGWLTHWQENNARRSGTDLAETLKIILSMKANVDFYMFFGGTNFGFWAGANDWGIGRYMADITSYDYDAPMDEGGNPTNKYMAFRAVIKEYLDIPDEYPVPAMKPKMILPSVKLNPIDTILSPNGRSFLGSRPIQSNTLLTFEQLNQFSGFVLYETMLPALDRDPSNLVVSDLRDRALIYIDDEFVGALSRENYINTLPISAGYGSKLEILVENQGRINFDIANDYKGILGSVRVQTFDANYDSFEVLRNWTITGYEFDNYDMLDRLVDKTKNFYPLNSNGILMEGPVLFHGEFTILPNTEIHDTFWDCSGWGKGYIFINGFNLGRYWPLVGPQITMYIPKDLLKNGLNVIMIVELQNAPTNGLMKFTDNPIFINDNDK